MVMAVLALAVASFFTSSSYPVWRDTNRLVLVFRREATVRGGVRLLNRRPSSPIRSVLFCNLSCDFSSSRSC